MPDLRKECPTCLSPFPEDHPVIIGTDGKAFTMFCADTFHEKRSEEVKR